jgi:hypothetical protein
MKIAPETKYTDTLVLCPMPKIRQHVLEPLNTEKRATTIRHGTQTKNNDETSRYIKIYVCRYPEKKTNTNEPKQKSENQIDE